MLLPDDIDISERSRKFYDGTYTFKWDGFVDEHGVYRAFDCYDPAARAPTPLPPMFRPNDGQVGEDRMTESSARFRFAPESAGGTPVTVLQDDLFREYDDRERLLGKIEGIQATSRQQGTELSQAECYHLCGISYPGGVQGTASMFREQESRNDASTIETLSKDASVSPLSECPSDLSDWEHDSKAGSNKQAAESKAQDKTPTKPTTRGVAQKVVRKTPKKSATAPALVSRAQEGGWGRRKSARQAKAFIHN